MKHVSFIFAICALLLCSCTCADKGETKISEKPLDKAAFKAPPRESQPWCYWWWVNGHVDKETIKKDLADMKKLGFGGFLLFDARGYWEDSRHLLYPKPKCEFMDETWRKNFAFAMEEAAKLGLTASANLSSCAGRLKGPWEVGADAPKRLICKITPLKSGKGRTFVRQARWQKIFLGSCALRSSLRRAKTFPE